MEFTLLTYNNRVGILTDALLLQDILEESNLNSKIIFLHLLNHEHKSDVGIWIQDYYEEFLSNFKINIFFINEEWYLYPLENLKKFDYVICKSKHAQKLISPYCNAICMPFLSYDVYDENIKRENKFLHFMGRSIQKNSELVIKQNIPITFVDSYNRFSDLNSNITHIKTYQSKEEIHNILNSHNIHICISLYESWGHYLFEGLSTGAEIICSDIPVFNENLDPNLVHFISSKNCNYVDGYLYNYEDKFKLRESYHVNPDKFTSYIENFKPIGKNNERRQLFFDIMSKNRNNIKYFFRSI